ncbi:hypothetical protein [Anaeromyxobacter paludicola]|uniref:Uncharacterized protein n=1 Tax=Anaeromyxobacter paludicola TaxID=2918171 RepID=A0ABN6NBW4_9BACT|nr:hypothetical protein [Anaeromyxobacter paludicola]BDG09901.1 hypothetical protein AMPC_30140 [Anaeromyxobacter paludicola]
MPLDRRAPRQVAVWIWTGMLCMSAAFLVTTLTLAVPPRVAAWATPWLFWVSVAVAAAAVVLSRHLPLRITPRQAGGRPEVVATARLLVGWSLCAGAGAFALLARVASADPRLVGVFVLCQFGVLTLYPSPSRWALMADLPDVPMAGPGRMVR